MKIDYVVISSDQNPLYKDFYKPVSDMWNKFGYKTIMIEISDENSKKKINENYYIKYKSVSGINTGIQSQLSRLFVFNEFLDKNLLISDIDMLPLNGEYFSNIASEVDNKILIYSGQPYGNVPYFPMCYILSSGYNMVKILNICNLNFENFILYLVNKYKGAWNTDENYFYDCLINNVDLSYIKRDRNFNMRIDRDRWVYDKDKLKNGYYIDSHLLRPYNKFKKEIDNLINDI